MNGGLHAQLRCWNLNPNDNNVGLRQMYRQRIHVSQSAAFIAAQLRFPLFKPDFDRELSPSDRHIMLMLSSAWRVLAGG